MNTYSLEVVDCPVCFSPQHTILFKDRNRRGTLQFTGTYVLCGVCGVVYLRDRPAWKTIATFYSSGDRGDPSSNPGLCDWKLHEQDVYSIWRYWWKKIFPSPHSWPREGALPGQRLLDIGCGSGAKLTEYFERGYEVWGIDIGKDSIGCCRALFPEGYFILGELLEANLPAGYFHAIRLDNCLEHVPDPVRTIQETFRILAPGGRLFVYVPNGRSLSMRILGKYSISSWIPFHLQLFNKSSLSRMLYKCGFEKVSIRGYSPLPWWPLSVLQLVRKENTYRDGAVPKWLMVALAPLGWVGRLARAPEEWVVTALKV